LIGVSEKIEPVFILSSVILGSAILIPGYRRKHRRCSCLALFVGGLFCLVVLRRLDWMPVPDAALTGIGAGLIIGAHALNRKFLKQCECCKDQPSHASSLSRDNVLYPASLLHMFDCASDAKLRLGQDRFTKRR
jgi:hypothetical protein